MTYEQSLYFLRDCDGRYYGWVRRPTRRIAGDMGMVSHRDAFLFCEFQHPSDAAREHLGKIYGRAFYVEREES